MDINQYSSIIANKKNVDKRLILDTPFTMKSIISYGLIVYANDTKKWIVIQRKHTVEFLLYVLGLYRNSYLHILLSCITKEEKKIIYKCIRKGEEYFKYVYNNVLKYSLNNYENSLKHFISTREYVSTIISKINISGKLSWNWPKGRINHSNEREKETPIECAKREFFEEVEVKLPDPIYISNTYIIENTKTITGKNIESRYWVYIIPFEFPISKPDHNLEVSDRSWFDTPTCNNIINNNKLFEYAVKLITTI